MKVGVLGLGGNGRGKIFELKKSKYVDGIVGMDIDPQAATTAARQTGVETTTEFGTILGDPAIELVFVSSSNDAHKDLTVASLEAGKAVL